MMQYVVATLYVLVVSVLFSEPKIPQFKRRSLQPVNLIRVSVLFSEPKIPQFSYDVADVVDYRVSVLFSEPKIPQSWIKQQIDHEYVSFQCSSASRKFLNSVTVAGEVGRVDVSVLFSEPKIPQFLRKRVLGVMNTLFQCSSASRKFLNCMV